MNKKLHKQDLLSALYSKIDQYSELAREKCEDEHYQAALELQNKVAGLTDAAWLIVSGDFDE